MRRPAREPVRLLLADPPWQFRDKLPGNGRGAEKNYATLNVEAVKRFPLPPIADDAVLLLWRVAAMQQEALDVARAWGFVVKSEFVWVKAHNRTVTGALQMHFGMGRYVRNCHETCLIATRGRATKLVKDRSTRSVFFAERPPQHSAKPPEFYALVESLFSGPYCELFARERREGWESYGAQLPGGAASTSAA